MEEGFVIEELKAGYSASELNDIDALMHQLSPSAGCDAVRLSRVIESPDCHLIVLRYGSRIIGCATLCEMYTTEMAKGGVEALAVLDEFRGRGLGRRLVRYAVELARSLGIQQLHLTSNPRRVAANALYRSMGFELYQTNYYRMNLE